MSEKTNLDFKIALIDPAIPPYPLIDFDTPPNTSRAQKVKDQAGEYYTYEVTEDFAAHSVASTAKIEYDSEKYGAIKNIIQVRYALLGNKTVSKMMTNRQGANELITIYPMKRELISRDDGKDENGNKKVRWEFKWVQLTEKECK
jgi:hypothetical protein